MSVVRSKAVGVCAVFFLTTDNWRLVTGGVAQLGERLLCKQEVIGSIPFASMFRCQAAGFRCRGWLWRRIGVGQRCVVRGGLVSRTTDLCFGVGLGVAGFGVAVGGFAPAP